jgi:hypothetical protein
MELAFPISRDLEIFDATRGCHQITKRGAVAIAFAFGTTFSRGHSQEGVELFAHHGFYHRANGTLSKTAQGGVKFLLAWQQWG